MTNPRLDTISSLALVGAGKMGGAMLDGWLALGLDPRKVSIFDPHVAPEIAALAAKGVALNPAKEQAGRPAVIILAVKPQMAAEVMPNVAALAGPHTLVLSVMAGKTIGFLENALPGIAVVRATRLPMPGRLSAVLPTVSAVVIVGVGLMLTVQAAGQLA